MQAPADVLQPWEPIRRPGGYWDTQLGLKLALTPQYFHIQPQLEVTCVSRLGSIFEGRASWRIKLPNSGKDRVMGGADWWQDYLSNSSHSPQSTSDSQYARRTQPVVGSYSGLYHRAALLLYFPIGRVDGMGRFLIEALGRKSNPASNSIRVHILYLLVCTLIRIRLLI